MPTLPTDPAPGAPPRLAAIDVGSNSMRLVVAEVQPTGGYRIVTERRDMTRLAGSLASSGRLDEQAIAKSLSALRRFKSIAEDCGVCLLQAIATCAVREAANGAEFVARAAAEAGVELQVIDAQQEAELAFASVRRRVDLAERTTLLADIGGGSTELVVAASDAIQQVFATQLGAVRLAEKFSRGGELSELAYREMVAWIDDELGAQINATLPPLELLIGSGGTFTSAATIAIAASAQPDQAVAGFRMSLADLQRLLDRLRAMTREQRRGVPGLSPDRADIVVPGMAIIERIMQRLHVDTLQVHPLGVRDGLLLAMIDELQCGGGNDWA